MTLYSVSTTYICVCVLRACVYVYVFGQETLSSKVFQLAITGHIISLWSDSSNVFLFYLKANAASTLSPINIHHRCLYNVYS